MNNIENSSGVIKVFLLGKPKIVIGNEEILFPFKQAEAIFYYLMIEGNASKGKIADLIWGDKYDDEKIKSNMRNALYIIRKIFGKDFLIEAQKNVIQINSCYNIKMDIDTAFNGMDLNKREVFCSEFLEGFYLKDNELYNNWVDNLKQHYKDIFVDRLTKCIASSFDTKDYETCETYCYELMKLNEFEDLSYKYLIDIYKINKQYNKAISIYEKLETLLEEELFETPNKDIVNMVNEVKQERNRRVSEMISSKNQTAIYVEKNKNNWVRKKEIQIIADLRKEFGEGKNPQSILIEGEEGVGKTYLAMTATQILEHEQFKIETIITKCYKVESTYVLKSWQTIFEKLLDLIKNTGDENYLSLLNSMLFMYPFLRDDNISGLSIDEIASMKFENIENKITDTLIKIAKTNRMILVFDDIQWADEATISLIKTIITADKNKNILFIFTFREDTSAGYVEQFIGEMRMSKFLKSIYLERLNYEQTITLAQEIMPSYDFTENFKNQLYAETEGNPFFIIEMMHNIECNGTLGDITPNIRDVIKNRIMYITPENKKILELLSMFFDNASFDVLLDLSNKKDYELLEILEYLINHRLIEETCTNNVYYSFTHKKIMEYVYNEMSHTKRVLLHNKIGNYFEQKLASKSTDVLIYTKLIHHFEKGNNKNKYLKYIIKYIHCYLNTAHEYFHLVENDSDKIYKFNAKLGVTDIYGIEKMLKNISNMVNDNFDFVTDKESIELISDYYHMIGRYYIRKVEYKNGLEYIVKLKNLNLMRLNEQGYSNVIKSNRQFMCVYINRYETRKMKEIIDESFDILAMSNKDEEKAIWYRLNGLYEIMTSNVEKGISDLSIAIDIFERSKDKEKYLFNLAASYAWIGEGKRHQMEYEEARVYYDKAIQICDTYNLLGGVSTFYAYAGMAALDSGHLEQAEKYLKQSIDYYEKTDLLWGRALAYAYYSLLQVKTNSYDVAKICLEKAAKDAERIDSNYERGVVNRICFQISEQMERDLKLKSTFKEIIKEEKNYYRDKAIILLKKVYSPIDMDYLK